MKKIILIGLLLSLSNLSYAGFNGLTHHSRANCVNNESISWDWTRNWLTWVFSAHTDVRTGTVVHELSSAWQNTWRNAMVHWGEGRGGWSVTGRHFMKNARGDAVLAQSETVTDCSVYDGWWDRNK